MAIVHTNYQNTAAFQVALNASDAAGASLEGSVLQGGNAFSEFDNGILNVTSQSNTHIGGFISGGGTFGIDGSNLTTQSPTITHIQYADNAPVSTIDAFGSIIVTGVQTNNPILTGNINQLLYHSNTADFSLIGTINVANFSAASSFSVTNFSAHTLQNDVQLSFTGNLFYSSGNVSGTVSAVSLSANGQFIQATGLGNLNASVLDSNNAGTILSTFLSGNDTIFGDGIGQTLQGFAGNDTLIGGSGNDTLDGGTGVDTASYTGAFRQYHLNGNPAGTTTLLGPQGTDTLVSIEKLSFVDGSLYFDPLSHVAQVERLYEATLGRGSDPLGLNGWTGLLDSGGSLNTAANSFAGSAEFTSTYGKLNDQQFVAQLYQNVLHRAADTPGLNGWVGFINAGHARGEVVVGFSDSGEFINNHAAQTAAGYWDIDETAASVARLYLGALARGADVAGLSGWVGAIKGGQLTLAQAANSFAGSAEFTNNYGALDNQHFVQQLYLNVLGREADTPGLNGWVGAMNTGGFTRGDVLKGFTEASEYQLNTIGQIDHGVHAVDAHFP